MRFPGGAALHCWGGGAAWPASSEMADGSPVTKVNHFTTVRLEPEKDGAAVHPAGRGRHPRLAEAALCRTQKKALAEGRTILWANEAGFYLLPALLRTWVSVAQIPVIRRKLSYDHLNAISAISLTGELYLAVQDHAYKVGLFK